MSWLAEWYNIPFVLAIGLSLLVLLLDALTGLVGDALDFDVDVDLDSPGVLGVLFSWVGGGRVPFSIILITLCFLFGVVGLCLSWLVGLVWPVGIAGLSLVATIPISLLVSLVFTRVCADGLARVMPGDVSTSRDPADFVGEIVTARTPITGRPGQVRTKEGALLTAVVPVNSVHVERGQEALVVGYDRERRIFTVEAVFIQGVV